ncbi:MAG: hypothetical protein HKP61_05030 [Dactylosporangium sp.]|nr:SAM-dependent methyltransferase [Dactylosporangium sp.]NNJ60310.1 hypothetical protein [Dactylosporangium sp.]
MNERDWRQGVDEQRPSPARVYDYFLGGSHNFAVDRAMAGQLQQAMPDIGDIMRANRDYLGRAVRFLVNAGIRQFLDLGSGVPTVGNVHELAQREAPDARVVYVDIDPVAVAHSAAILANNPETGIINADLRDADQVLAHETTRELLDFDQPIAVLLVGVLHQLPGDEPADAVRRYRAVMAPGSYLALSQPTQDGRPAEADAFTSTHARGYQETMVLRTRDEVASLLADFSMVAPGVVFLPQWHPVEPLIDETPGRLSTYAVVGKIPA